MVTDYTNLIHGTLTGYTYYACRCQACRQVNTYYQRKRRDVITPELRKELDVISDNIRKHREQLMKENKVKHGKCSTYTNPKYHCRCDKCTKAIRDYQRNRRNPVDKLEKTLDMIPLP